MLASKENAEKAIQKLKRIAVRLPPHLVPGSITGSMEFLEDFLKSAKKKLPSHAAYERANAKATR